MQMFTLSIITWVLITGFFFIRSKTISFLEVALSNAYKMMLESTKKSAFVRFISVKFKIAHVYAVFSPEIEGLFSFRLTPFFSSRGNAKTSTCFPTNSSGNSMVCFVPVGIIISLYIKMNVIKYTK